MRDIETLISELTIEEKAALVEGVDTWKTNSVPRLKIPSLFMTDGPHGLRKAKETNNMIGISEIEYATAFPPSAAVACSWNPEHAYQIGKAIAIECAATGVDVLLAPGVNIKRSPLCGRNFEYYSEDPLVSGMFGSAFVDGVQSRGIGCSLKHFAANSSEDYRFVGDSVVDERALREIYLRAFERVVRDAQPFTVMCSYNRVNGTFASENQHLLMDILRDEWGFDGAVMTDWGATCNRIEGVKAGCDLDMPGEVWYNRKSIIEAANNNILPMEVLDRAVSRILALGENCCKKTDEDILDLEAHARLSCDVAKESAVLLKNDGVLPLNGQEKLVVVGEMFERMRFQGAGSSLVNPPKVITPKDAFDRRRISYTYEKGFRCSYPKRDAALEKTALSAAKNSDVILFFGGLTDFEESEGFDRPHMRLGQNQDALLRALLATEKKVVLVLFAGAPVELPLYDSLAAVLNMSLPGMYGGDATAALLFGESSPSGKLAESWPKRVEDTACFGDFDTSPIAKYYESVYVGYRFYDKAKTNLQFPFGYGLSYTTFEYNHVSVSENSGRVIVSVDLSNTGKRDGAEAVQLYVRNDKSKVFKADKELRAFTKIFLKAGETRTVDLAFDRKDLAYWNVKKHDWVLENGVYELCIAASATDIRLTAQLCIAGEQELETPYSSAVLSAYAEPPQSIPVCFAELIGAPVPDAPSRKPITLESPLRDLKQTLAGRIIYTAVMAIINTDYRKANRMPDSLERDTQLKNAYFVVRMMPSNSIRSMCMSSSGRFSYNVAIGFVEMANGHIIRGLKSMLKKEVILPLPSAYKEDIS